MRLPALLSCLSPSVRIQCSNTRINLDSNNLHVNSTYFFDLLDDKSGSMLAKVTIRCHVTTRVVQLQGSNMILSSKAPLWFFHNVLQNTFDREGTERRASILKTNEDIIQLASTDLPCTFCERYKTAPGLQKHLQLSMNHLLRVLHKYSQQMPGSFVRGGVLTIL